MAVLVRKLQDSDVLLFFDELGSWRKDYLELAVGQLVFEVFLLLFVGTLGEACHQQSVWHLALEVVELCIAEVVRCQLVG